jgi:mannose-6-phosphate isomerase-like protein (cupin superfamily)
VIAPLDQPIVIAPGEGMQTPLARVGVVHKVPSAFVEGRLAAIEHVLPPRVLGAPLHRHSREDELSMVLTGSMAVQLGDRVVTVGPGAYVLKARGQWHTCWNPGGGELRFLEIMVPGGGDEYLARMSSLLRDGCTFSSEIVQRVAMEYGLEFDLASGPLLCERHRLTC